MVSNSFYYTEVEKNASDASQYLSGIHLLGQDQVEIAEPLFRLRAAGGVDVQAGLQFSGQFGSDRSEPVPQRCFLIRAIAFLAKRDPKSLYPAAE